MTRRLLPAIDVVLGVAAGAVVVFVILLRPGWRRLREAA